jgi:hypothetical protein
MTSSIPTLSATTLSIMTVTILLRINELLTAQQCPSVIMLIVNMLKCHYTDFRSTMTLSIMALSIPTLSAMTLSITTLSTQKLLQFSPLCQVSYC